MINNRPSAIVHRPLVSVLIVSYNTRAETAKSVQSALDSQGFTPGEIEIILVDNNSSDGTAAYIRKHFPQVQIIASQTNLGYGRGNNLGAKKAAGRYLLLLNPDAYLAEDSLWILTDTLEQHPELVAVGPQLTFPDGSVQPSAGYLPTLGRVMAWMWWLDKLPLVKLLFPRPYHVYDPDWHTRQQYPEWLTGACLMFRKEEFEKVGGFDEKIFMYAEEVELFMRLKKSLGKKILFTPAAKAVHVGGVSTKKAQAHRLARELKGIEYIYQKHVPRLLWIVRLVIYTGVVLRLAVFSLLPGRRESLVEYRNYFAKT